MTIAEPRGLLHCPILRDYTEMDYDSVFSELKDSLRPFRRDLPTPSAAEGARLRSAATAARALIDKERLRTRAEALAHGALRRGTQYLEERDQANLATAEKLLHGL